MHRQMETANIFDNNQPNDEIMGSAHEHIHDFAMTLAFECESQTPQESTGVKSTKCKCSVFVLRSAQVIYIL